jgi:hemerythrin-like domain-containing protein
MNNHEKSLISDRLIADHIRLTDLLERLLSAFAANDRDEIAKLWNQFDVGLTTHLEVEEQYLFPDLATFDPESEEALRAEHDVFREQLLDLGIRVDLHTVRLDATRAFSDALMKHAHREEQILYTWADRHVAAEKRASLLREVEKAAKPLVTSGAAPAPRGAARP